MGVSLKMGEGVDDKRVLACPSLAERTSGSLMSLSNSFLTCDSLSLSLLLPWKVLMLVCIFIISWKKEKKMKFNQFFMFFDKN